MKQTARDMLDMLVPWAAILGINVVGVAAVYQFALFSYWNLAWVTAVPVFIAKAFHRGSARCCLIAFAMFVWSFGIVIAMAYALHTDF